MLLKYELLGDPVKPAGPLGSHWVQAQNLVPADAICCALFGRFGTIGITGQATANISGI